MAKRVDPLKAKQRKQKIVAAVLGVVFLGVAAFQGPKLWKQLHPKNAGPRPSYDAQPASATTGATPSLAAPTLGGSAAPSAAPANPSLASATPTVEDGQLNSFSLFASKDPFAQQLSDEQSVASSPSTSGGSGATRSHGGTPATGGSATGGSGSASAPTPGTAVISVNGTLYTVAVGTDFPSASSTDPSIVPLFHLVSLTAHSAKISIVGGSYSSGAPTVNLTVNKPVTLMNTADQTRYKLVLKPVGTAVPSAPAATSTTSTTVTVPPPG